MMNLLGIGLGRNLLGGLPYRFRQMKYYLREFESPRGAVGDGGAGSREEGLNANRLKRNKTLGRSIHEAG